MLVDFGGDRRFEGRIRAAVRIEAKSESIWAILRDCESAPAYVPNVLGCELLETLEDESAQVFRQQVKLAWFLPGFEHDFRLDYEPYTRIAVSRVAGPIDILEGAWWLVPADDSSVTLVYSLQFEPGMPIPRFVLGRILRRDVPIVLAEVRDRAEAL
ncbi:MAG TPA: SRPBCC family protein [Gammaproteobacteria bacterium]